MSDDKKKLPPDEAWDALERSALRDEAERVNKLSDAQLDEELRRKGRDPEALRARGASLAARLKEKQAAGSPAGATAAGSPAGGTGSGTPPGAAGAGGNGARSLRSRWTARRFAWAGGATAAAAGVVLALSQYAMDMTGNGKGGNEAGPDATTEQRAAGLREQAVTACRERRWTECKQKVDEAKTLDPEGWAKDPRVQELRVGAPGPTQER
jgi:hypothetical protein